MFGFSFSEIGLIAIVALLALGPERLPKAARTAGALLRRARASWQNVRDEIEREFAADDLMRTVNVAKHDAANIRDANETAEPTVATATQQSAKLDAR